MSALMMLLEWEWSLLASASPQPLQLEGRCSGFGVTGLGTVLGLLFWLCNLGQVTLIFLLSSRHNWHPKKLEMEGCMYVRLIILITRCDFTLLCQTSGWLKLFVVVFITSMFFPSPSLLVSIPHTPLAPPTAGTLLDPTSIWERQEEFFGGDGLEGNREWGLKVGQYTRAPMLSPGRHGGEHGGWRLIYWDHPAEGPRVIAISAQVWNLCSFSKSWQFPQGSKQNEPKLSKIALCLPLQNLFMSMVEKIWKIEKTIKKFKSICNHTIWK